MSTPRWDSEHALGRQLLDAGRREAPPEQLARRALERASHVDLDRRPAQRRLGLIAGGAFAVAAAAGLLWLTFGRMGAEPGQPTSPPSPTAVVASPAPRPEPSSSVEPIATATVASGTLEDAGQDAASPAATAVARLDPPAPPKPKSATSSAPPATAGAPGPGRSACGCAPADLMCNMRCAEKRK